MLDIFPQSQHILAKPVPGLPKDSPTSDVPKLCFPSHQSPTLSAAHSASLCHQLRIEHSLWAKAGKAGISFRKQKQQTTLKDFIKLMVAQLRTVILYKDQKLSMSKIEKAREGEEWVSERACVCVREREGGLGFVRNLVNYRNTKNVRKTAKFQKGCTFKCLLCKRQ